MKFLDYAHNVDITKTNTSFNKDGVILFNTRDRYCGLFIDNQFMLAASSVGGTFIYLPLKAGQQVRKDNDENQVYVKFIPFI